MGALLLIAVALVAASRFLHVSITTGMMGYMFPVYAIPVMALALVAWAVAAGKLPDRPRRLALIVVVALAAGGWTMVRTEGFSGYIDHGFALRWTKTPEERLLALANDEPARASRAAAPAPAPAPAADKARRRRAGGFRVRSQFQRRSWRRRSGRASADPRATASSAA